MKIKSLEIKVGVLIIIAIAILVGFVILLGDFSFQKGKLFYVEVTNSSNIQPGAPVKISGIKIGKVREVTFNPKISRNIEGKIEDRVYVRIKVWTNTQAFSQIKVDSEIAIATSGVLGEKYLEITPGSETTPSIKEGDALRGSEAGTPEALISKFSAILKTIGNTLLEDPKLIERFLNSSATLISSLNELVKENKQTIKLTIGNLHKVSEDGVVVTRGLRKVLEDPKKVGQIIDNVEGISAKINYTIGGLITNLNDLLKDGKDVTALIKSFSKGTSPKGENAISQLLQTLNSIKQLSEEGRSLVRDVKVITQGLRQGKGTVGAFLTDQEIYDDLKEFVRTIKQHPWKLIWKK